MTTTNCLLRRSHIPNFSARGILSILFMVFLVAGCSGGPSRIQAPSFDPAGAASKAMELYDTDGDGFVAGEELEKAPGLNAALNNFDGDGDGKISQDEIFGRVSEWVAQDLALMYFTCEVSLDGRPLDGATVTFVPEEFLGSSIHEAVDTTNVVGIASPTVAKENRPSATSPPGVQPGLYKVRVSKVVNGQESIPSIYNAETTLGKEVSSDDKAIANKQVRFRLKSQPST